HDPPSEQRILTPVPLYAQVGPGLDAAKVQVRYHPFGSSAWKTVDMKQAGRGFVAEIPGLVVGTTTRDLKYYLQVVDTAGDVVALSGSRNAPNAVAIKNQLTGPAPHLPGLEPPAACVNPADCPPGLPGCTASAKAKVEHGEKAE